METREQPARALVEFRGERATTRAAAITYLSAHPRVLWVSDVDEHPNATSMTRSAVRRCLGASYDAVVVDHHEELDAETLGRCHGFVLGGGVLLIRSPASPRSPVTRFGAHWTRTLGQHPGLLSFDRFDSAEPLAPRPYAAFNPRGTAEQDAVVKALLQVLGAPSRAHAVVVADRGRGKSAALGMALGQLDVARRNRIGLTGPAAQAVAEVVRFADDYEFLPFVELANRVPANRFDLVVIDEAAQLPLPLLKHAVSRHPMTRFVFATTVHGYEGTGRGFSLRFLPWLQARPTPVRTMTLAQPIRWGAGDTVEATIFKALVLDADLPALEHLGDHPTRIVARPICRDALVASPEFLRAFFGLLVQAHYRTTPRDLQQLLDAPNVDLHGLFWDDTLVGATWIAHEGGWTPALTEAVRSGARRVRGDALPESLVAHLGHCEAGPMTMLRSVRIAIHPEVRLRGLGSTLVEHVHEQYSPALFGTLFGATAELIAFRRSLGYQVVRISASRGARSGEPSVVMVRPVSDGAIRLVQRLRAEFARDLPLQLALMTAGDEVALSPALHEALTQELPDPATMTDIEAEQASRDYAFGPQTFESRATAVTRFVTRNVDRLSTLPPAEAAILKTRVLARTSWTEALEAARLPNHRMGMRALRRGVRGLLERGEE